MSRPVTRTLGAQDLRAVRALFDEEGHSLRKNPKNEYIAFEVRTPDRSIFTAYTSGKLVSTVRPDDVEGQRLEAAISELVGGAEASPARRAPQSSGRPWLGGADETGTGELLGQAILGGALFPASIAPAVARVAGHVETKQSRRASGWEFLNSRLIDMRADGLLLVTVPIPNRLFDTYSKNGLLDLAYIRMVGDLLCAAGDGVARDQIEMVIDDYGTGPLLNRAVAGWREQGLSVVVKTKADDSHLAPRIGSVVARARRSLEMEGIAAEAEGRVGTGNAGDRATLGWLSRWADSGRPWPSFVKTSFKTVREMQGRPAAEKQPLPPLEELLDEPGVAGLMAGRLDTAKARLRGPGGKAVRKLKVPPTDVPDEPLALRLLPLLCSGLVLDPGVCELELLDELLDREAGLLSGWRVLVGPQPDEADAVLVALARAHRAGIIQVVPTTEPDPVARAKAAGAVLVTDKARSSVLALQLVR